VSSTGKAWGWAGRPELTNGPSVEHKGRSRLSEKTVIEVSAQTPIPARFSVRKNGRFGGVRSHPVVPDGNQMFSDTLADRPVGTGCAIGGRNPPLSHQSVLILSAYAYQEGVSLVLAGLQQRHDLFVP
jgi:hypothetical protein